MNAPESISLRNSNKPLVTIAVLAYNQENYVPDAIIGALSQTYEPLEIILSDDCSTDATFEVMRQFADNYKGPHRILARQCTTNLGPYLHVLDVAKAAKGGLLVLAAGDDISKSNRVAELAKFWIETSAWGLHSRFDEIDQTGTIVSENQRSESLLSEKCELRQYFFKEDGPVEIVHGATSAYDIRLFRLVDYQERRILSEDGVFTIILNAYCKKVVFVEQSLIRYRVHRDAITNTARSVGYLTFADASNILRREAIYSKNIVTRAEMFLALFGSNIDGVRRMNFGRVRQDIDVHAINYAWKSMPLGRKYRSARFAFEKRSLGFVIPVLLGRVGGIIYIYLSMNFKFLFSLFRKRHKD
jgi:glycosyltransferase involved in cell wall biosynthesis